MHDNTINEERLARLVADMMSGEHMGDARNTGWAFLKRAGLTHLVRYKDWGGGDVNYYTEAQVNEDDWGVTWDELEEL